MKNLNRGRPGCQKAKKYRKDQEPTRNIHCRRKRSERYFPNALDSEAGVQNSGNERITGRMPRGREAMGLGDMTWRGMESDPRKPRGRVYVKNRALTWGWFCIYRWKAQRTGFCVEKYGISPLGSVLPWHPWVWRRREWESLGGILGTWGTLWLK